MSTTASVKYNVFSENLNVGVLPTSAQDSGEPVQLAVPTAEPWTASTQIASGVNAYLGVAGYQYTGIYNGEVFASGDSKKSQYWYFTTEGSGTYLVSTDNTRNLVWTSVGEDQPIKLMPYSGEDNQKFKFLQIK